MAACQIKNFKLFSIRIPQYTCMSFPRPGWLKRKTQETQCAGGVDINCGTMTAPWLQCVKSCLIPTTTQFCHICTMVIISALYTHKIENVVQTTRTRRRMKTTQYPQPNRFLATWLQYQPQGSSGSPIYLPRISRAGRELTRF